MRGDVRGDKGWGGGDYSRCPADSHFVALGGSEVMEEVP